MRIALFDDDPDTRQLIEDFLNDNNHKIISIAKDNPQELQYESGCDALIIDVRTRTDRYAGVNYILAQRASNKIKNETKVIFISNFGRDNIELLNLLLTCGDYVWLDVPIEFASLKRILFEHEKSLEK